MFDSVTPIVPSISDTVELHPILVKMLWMPVSSAATVFEALHKHE